MIKIGDKVTIKCDIPIYRGDIGKVIDVDKYEEFGKVYKVEFDNGSAYFTEEQIERK